MPQYKVPQNIDLEDKIVGPFTMKQFIYLMAGGGLIYGLYQAWLPYEDGVYYTIAAGIPIAFFSFALTFIKINDRPFEYFLSSLWAYLFKPRRRIWQQGYEFRRVVMMAPPEKKEEINAASGKRATLDEIAARLESQASNTGSVLPQKQPPTTNNQPPTTTPERPDSFGRAGNSQTAGARFTVEDLKRGQDAVNPIPADGETLPTGSDNTNTPQNQIPPDTTPPAPITPPPPAKPSAASILKSIGSIFSKASGQDTSTKIPASTATSLGRQDTNAPSTSPPTPTPSTTLGASQPTPPPAQQYPYF